MSPDHYDYLHYFIIFTSFEKICVSTKGWIFKTLSLSSERGREGGIERKRDRGNYFLIQICNLKDVEHTKKDLQKIEFAYFIQITYTVIHLKFIF